MKQVRTMILMWPIMLISILFAHAAHAGADSAVMVEFGFGLDHMSKSKTVVVRYRRENVIVHAATWFGGDRKHNVAVGVGGWAGSPIKRDDNDLHYGGDVGLALVFNDLDQPLQFYAHGQMGLTTTNTIATHVSITSYVKNPNVHRTFITGGVTKSWNDEVRDDPNFDPYNENGDGDGGDDDDDEECQPGNGIGDDNHCHDGPPGQE